MSFTMLFPPTLGRVRANARAQLLAESLSHQLGERAVVTVAKNYRELESRIFAKDVDVAWAPPSICARAEELQWPILKSVRQGQSMYRSVLVCRKKDKLSVGTIKNLRAAWVDPLSTGGHLLAIALLRKHGINLAEGLRSQEFHGSYQGALLSILRDEADLSSIYAYGMSEVDVAWSLHEHVGASGAKLTGFAFTEESPADGLIHSGQGPLAERLFSVLLEDDDNRGRTLLLELIEAETLELAGKEDYAPIQRALREVNLYDELNQETQQ